MTFAQEAYEVEVDGDVIRVMSAEQVLVPVAGRAVALA